MATRRLVILAAALFLLFAAPRPAFPSTAYVVRKGDTLSGISKRFHVPAEKIRAANGLSSDRLVAGKRLRIPGKDAGKRAASRKPSREGSSAAPAVRSAGPPQTHTVHRGDTLRSISRKYDVPEKDLRRQNRMGKEKRLRPGTRIVVRKALPESYAVREGDTLSGIARKFGVAAEELTRWNGLESDVIVPGQRLAMYERAKEPEARPEPGPVPEVVPDPPLLAGGRPLITEEELLEAARPMADATQGSPPESIQDRIIRVAKKMLSTPYVWGGTSLTGMDCSGYVWKVFAMLNFDLPRSAREQFRIGREVERENLSVGDLVFFRTYAKYPSHVGIYLGDNRFIHASSRSRQVKISSLDQPYYEKRYIGAKRLLFGENDVVN